MTCPFLEYRSAGVDREFDEARAYCTAVERFVQPMRADIFNDRYDLDHATDCEIFLAHADELDDGAADDRDDGQPDDDGRDEPDPQEVDEA